MNIDTISPQREFRQKTPMGVEYARRGEQSFVIYREPHHTDSQIADSINFLAQTKKGTSFSIKKPKETPEQA
jgi:hypothetical protein